MRTILDPRYSSIVIIILIPFHLSKSIVVVKGRVAIAYWNRLLKAILKGYNMSILDASANDVKFVKTMFVPQTKSHLYHTIASSL